MKNIDDNQTTISELRDIVKEFVNEREWNSYHTPKSLSIAISIEAAELLEHFLFLKNEELPDEPKRKEEFENEMADIFIYLMSLANSMKLSNFTEIVLRKMEKNRLKYPIDKFSGSNYQKQ